MGKRNRKKVYIGRFSLCVVCSILWLMCFFAVDAYAQEREEHCEEGGFSLTATFSLQDGEAEEITLRAGRDFALALEVKTQEEFSGYVNVLMQNEEENHVLYQQRIETISPGESVSCQMLLPMNLMTAGLYLTLTDEAGEIKLEHTIPVETVNYGMYELVAVFDPEQEMPEENAYGHFSSYGNQLIKVSESEIAQGAQALDALEVIVTQETVLVKLEESAVVEVTIPGQETEEMLQGARAAESLKEWVASGKTLVVGASAEPGADEEMLNFGLQEKELLQEVILRVGNYEATRESILATNEEIKKQYGKDARTYYMGDSMIGDTPVNSLSDKAVSLPIVRFGDGGHWWNSEVSYETLWQERGTDIVRCYHVGKGNVLVFAIPVTYTATGCYPLFYYRMAEMVFDNLTQTQLERQNADMYASGTENGNYLLTYIRARSNGISVFPYVVILMVYIVLLIPAVFLLLRHFEKTKYLWGVLPLLSFAVMGIVYLVGGKTRITQPYCVYLEVTDYTDGKGKQSVNFSLSAPTNEGTEIMLKQGATVRLAQTAFRAYDPGWIVSYVPAENTLRAREYRAAVCALADGTRLNVDTIRAFAKTNFYAWADAPEREGGLLAAVTSADKVVAGVIQNTTDIPFRQVYICNQDFVVRVGGIQPGESILLEDCVQRVADSNGWYWLLFETVENGNYAETNILNELFWNYMDDNPEMIYIFALPQQEGSEILGEAAQSPGSNGLSVFIWAAKDMR